MEDTALFILYAAIIAGTFTSAVAKLRASRASDGELRDQIRREHALRNSHAVMPLIVYPADIEERRRELSGSGRRRAAVSAALLIALAIVFLFF